VLEVYVNGARLEPWQERRKAAGRGEPIRGGEREEDDAKKSREERQGSHGIPLPEDRVAAKGGPGGRSHTGWSLTGGCRPPRVSARRCAREI
jgi:hypothetical protein